MYNIMVEVAEEVKENLFINKAYNQFKILFDGVNRFTYQMASDTVLNKTLSDIESIFTLHVANKIINKRDDFLKYYIDKIGSVVEKTLLDNSVLLVGNRNINIQNINSFIKLIIKGGNVINNLVKIYFGKYIADIEKKLNENDLSGDFDIFSDVDLGIMYDKQFKKLDNLEFKQMHDYLS